MAKESKRQLQISEVIRRNFGVVLQQEGSYIYGIDILVTVTSVKVTLDLGLAKIYLSVYNTEDKEAVILLLEAEYARLKSSLVSRIKKHTRRIPNFSMYLDETLDEMYKLNHVFDKLNSEKKSEEE